MTNGKAFGDEPLVASSESAGLIELERAGAAAPHYQWEEGEPGDAGPRDKDEARLPKTSAPAAERLRHLEAIRGLAALQVLALHAFSAFLPAIVFNRAAGGIQGLIHFSPLFLAYDGYSAVYMFFVLSGFVLTPLFGRFADRPLAVAASRWVRLAVPALVSALVAIGVRVAVGAAPAEAGRAIGSGWLSGNWRPPAGVAYFLYDALVQAPLAGYSETSLLADHGLPIVFHPIRSAYIAPFWTLSVEMQGSMLILALAMIARRSERLWRLAFVACAAVLFRTDFICFLIGHALSRQNAQAALRRIPAAALVGLVSLGVSLCVVQEMGFVARLTSCRAQGLAFIPCSSNSLKMIGAILLFVVALGSPALETILDRRPFVALGRLSFSLYLIHWPIVLGVGSVLYLVVGRGEDGLVARAVAIAAALVLSLLAAEAFSSVDAWAIVASRRVRGEASGGRR